MGGESAEITLDHFLKLPVPPAVPKTKPLDVHVARAASNNLILNTVNLNYEVREIVVAQGIQFRNKDLEITSEDLFPGAQLTDEIRNEMVIPLGLKNDFPDIVIQDATRAVFISDAQHVEFRIRVVNTKSAFKDALETPGIHVVYAGHSRFGRGPCFGPDLGDPPNLTGEDWETGTDTNRFGIFRMGRPFAGVPFAEDLDVHKYRMRPVPTTQKVSPADVDQLTIPGSLKPVILRGTRFESFIIDLPIADTYWGCKTVHGDGVLLFADFQNTPFLPPLPPPFPPFPPIPSVSAMDLGATNLQCRCFTLCGCDTLKHFHEIVRKRKGFTKSGNEGFAFFTVGAVPIAPATKFWLSSLLEFPERNDFQPWSASLDFAVKRTNQKAAFDRKFKYNFV